jgi:hypothetical protein
MFNSKVRFPLLTVLFLLFFSACALDETNVDSHGGFDEVLVLSDDANWDAFVKEHVEKSFEEPYPVLPQPENSIKITHVAFDKFEKIFKRFRNILIIADLEDQSDITKLAMQYLGEDLAAKAFNNPDFFVGKKNNVWANDQYVVFLFAPGKPRLEEVLKTKADFVKNLFLNNDLNRYHKAVMSIGKNKEIMKTIKDKHGFSIDIPGDYFVAKNDAELLWLRKETEEISFNLLIHETKTESDFQNRAIELRNYLGEKHVSSEIEGSYMVSDSTLPIETVLMKINGNEAYQSKGLWRLENDFMGGPFVSYYFQSPDKKKTYLVDAFIYAPGTKKKPQLRRMEALAATVRF